jgi:predicted ester cyclase
MVKLAIALATGLVCMTADSAAQVDRIPSSVSARELVIGYFRDVLDGGKRELLDSMFHPDCAIHRPEGDLKGLTALKALLQRGRTTFPEFATEIHDLFEADDRVVARITHRATGAGPYRFRIGTHNLTGKHVTWDAIAIFRIRDGKIAEEWVSRDELGMILSAGLQVSAEDAGRK